MQTVIDYGYTLICAMITMELKDTLSMHSENKQEKCQHKPLEGSLCQQKQLNH